MSNTALMVASSDEHFREMVRYHLLNVPNSKVVAEYQEVAANLYIRVLQDLERSPGAGLIVDLSGDPESAVKAIEKVKQAAPDLFVIVSNFHADGETVIACMRAGANEFLLQPLKRTEFRDAMGRLERAPKHATSNVPVGRAQGASAASGLQPNPASDPAGRTAQSGPLVGFLNASMSCRLRRLGTWLSMTFNTRYEC